MESMGLLICLLCSSLAGAQGSSQPIPCRRFIRAAGPVLLSAASSSEVVSLTPVLTTPECAMLCRVRGCLLLSFTASERACQLVLVKDASKGWGASGTHVERLVGAEAGAEVWMVEGLRGLLRERQVNITATFMSTGSGRLGNIQPLTINATGCYRIEAAGAMGGSNADSGKVGGKGALIFGTFNVTANTRLSVVVGQAGGPSSCLYCGGGGGGGSFVYTAVPGGDRLLIAAGGGGAGTYQQNGLPGEADVNGTDYNPNPAISHGGANGQPGFNDPSAMPDSHNHGGCGAGWLGKPVNPRRWTRDGGGGGGLNESWVGGLAGSDNTGHGGFGGGGGGGDFDALWGAAGAGGGFSGGGTGYSTSPPGGGGGSYCGGSGCSATTGGNIGSEHGWVVMRLISAFIGSCEGL